MVWTIDKGLDSVFNLPEGRYCANFGFLVEQSVSPDHVLTAAEALINANWNGKVASQAGIIVAAQKEGVAFEDWAELTLF